MIRINRFRVFIGVAFALWSCNFQTSKKSQIAPNQENKLQYAQNFRWVAHPDYDLLEVVSLRSKEVFRIVVLDSAQQAPKVPYNLVLQRPVERIIATATPHIAALEMLNGLDRVVGFPQPEYIYSEAARSRIQNKTIAPIGINNELNLEKIITLKPELFMGFEVDGINPDYTRLQQMGIPLVLIQDWLEESPLAKAEWLLFFGVVLGEKERALELFKSIEKRYNELKQKVPKSMVQPAQVVSGSVYKDQWYAPGGKSFFAQFLKDCGVNYLLQSNSEKGSISLSIEKLLLEGQSADVWLCPGSFDSYEALGKQYPMLQAIKPYQKKQIFTYKKEVVGQSRFIPYFEQAPYHPDRVLEDLLHIFYPDEFKQNFWHYFTLLQ